MNQEQIEIIKKIFVEEAQPIYDSWSQYDGYDDIFGDGGICDTIADTVIEVISHLGYETGMKSEYEPIPHSWIWVKINNIIYEFDIPFSLYEIYTSNNYNYPKFQKIENIIFETSDVITIKSKNNITNYL